MAIKDKPEVKQPTVFDEATQFVSTMENLKQAERKGLADLEKGNAALSEARKKQSQKMSATLIAGGELPENPPELIEEKRVELRRSAVVGIRKAVSDHDLGLLQLRERFTQARAAHNKKVADDWLERVYKPGLAAFQSVLRQGHALAEALGERLDPRATSGGLSQLLNMPSAERWSSDKIAKQLHDDNVSLRNVADRLLEYGFEAERRVKAADKNYNLRRLYDPSPKALYRVIRPFTDGFREYRVGEILDQLTLGFEQTRLEHQAGLLEKVLPADEVA